MPAIDPGEVIERRVSFERASTPPYPCSGNALCPKTNLVPTGGMNDLVRKDGTREIVKLLPAAMSQDQIGGILLLECRDDLVNVIIVKRRHDMEAADHRVLPSKLRRRLAPACAVDDPAMAA